MTDLLTQIQRIVDRAEHDAAQYSDTRARTGPAVAAVAEIRELLRSHATAPPAPVDILYRYWRLCGSTPPGYVLWGALDAWRKAAGLDWDDRYAADRFEALQASRSEKT